MRRRQRYAGLVDAPSPLPRLASPRLTLLPATLAEDRAYQALWSRPEVRRFLFDDRDVSLALAQDVLAAGASLHGRGLGLWSLRRRDDDAFIGCVGLLPVTAMAQFAPELAGEIEVLVALAPEAWGRGYAVEALKAAIDHAFGTLDLRALCAALDVPNVASHRALERVGFRCERECDGQLHRLRVYRLTRT
jgi:ribosomal-protein-alanine N-acetyltransferase